MEFELGDGAKARVIVVNGRYIDGRRVHLNPDEENEACIGLLIQYGTFRYFTAGDLTGGGTTGGIETKDMESIAGEIIGDIDVLHVGHHGSETSTNDTFLKEIKPEAAVISVGRDNDYHHPVRSVLRRLEAARSKVYRTDQQ
jgi:competence protein ComEC